MKLTALLVLFSAMAKPLAGSPIRGDRRNPNEIHVSSQEHRKFCEVSVHWKSVSGDLLETRVCKYAASDILSSGHRSMNHICKQQFIPHNNIEVPSGCALFLVKERQGEVEEEKHAEELPGSRECVGGERADTLRTLEVFFVQETIKIRRLNLQTEETVNAGCSTYYKD